MLCFKLNKNPKPFSPALSVFVPQTLFLCLSSSVSRLSQPTLRREGEAKRKRRLLKKEMHGVATNVYSRKTLEKPKRGLQILKRRVRELSTHGEGISTPCARHKGRLPLIECAKHDLKIMYFPFLCFFIFWGRQWCCLCSYVSSSAMRNSYLRSSLSLKVCVLNWFFMFLKDSFYLRTKSHLRRWTLK